MQLLDLFNAFKVQKNKKYIYKEDMNKGTLRSFCLKIFLFAWMPVENIDHNLFYRAVIFWIHVNILNDITLQLSAVSCSLTSCILAYLFKSKLSKLFP